MPTIFAVPKPFSGHIGSIQTNAIKSWLALRPACEVILFGDESGVEEAAANNGVRHVAHVQRNEFGTPLLDDVFANAQRLATRDVLCYVNADIVLLSDFVPAIERVRRAKDRFLIVGRRCDVDLRDDLDTMDPDWEFRLRRFVAGTGVPRSPEWIDYFVFNKDLFRTLLPFALGRAAFDNWLLWRATQEGAALVDASDQVLVVHQNHDYSHHPQGQQGVWEGPEAQRNRELMKTWDHCYFLTDATHRLTSSGLRRNVSTERLSREWGRRAKTRERWRRARMSALVRTHSFRSRIGLRRSSVKALTRRFRKAGSR